MSNHSHNLSIGEHGDRKMLLAPYAWHDPVQGLIEVPAGFLFDGASIPRLAWTIIGVTPFDHKIIHAAVIHDWLYSTRSLSRKLSDDVFKRIMKREGRLRRTSIFLIHRSVRIGGCRAYSKTRKLNEFYRPELINDYNSCNNE